MDWLTRALACPVCKSGLAASASVFRCLRGGLEFHQPRADCVQLLPPHAWQEEEVSWVRRQQETEEAYRELARDPAHAVLAYRTDLGPCAPMLATYRGRILDVGGGNGIVRHYLADDAEYVSVDPSLDWLDPSWLGIGEEFPCLRAPLAFVRGIGEYLPFGDDTFDAVLSIWSLNHVSRPAAVIEEMRRILRVGGRLLVVLDDVPPRWVDVMLSRTGARGVRGLAGMAGRKLLAWWQDWPIQSDHLELTESALARWTVGLERERRAWVGAYLTLEFRKPGGVRHA
jgi:SAM-dependent methyltransferase